MFSKLLPLRALEFVIKFESAVKFTPWKTVNKTASAHSPSDLQGRN